MVVPVAGAGVAIEDMLGPVEPGKLKTANHVRTERVAGALERLAAEVRSGGVALTGMNIQGDISARELIEQTVTVRFYIPEPKA